MDRPEHGTCSRPRLGKQERIEGYRRQYGPVPAQSESCLGPAYPGARRAGQSPPARGARLANQPGKGQRRVLVNRTRLSPVGGPFDQPTTRRTAPPPLGQQDPLFPCCGPPSQVGSGNPSRVLSLRPGHWPPTPGHCSSYPTCPARFDPKNRPPPVRALPRPGTRRALSARTHPPTGVCHEPFLAAPRATRR